MITSSQFQQHCLGLADSSAAPHVDRIAFRTPQRIFATLAADAATANLKLPPELQELLCAARPDAFAPVPGGWGRQGWTTMTFATVDDGSMATALAGAHALAMVGSKKPTTSTKQATKKTKQATKKTTTKKA